MKNVLSKIKMYEEEQNTSESEDVLNSNSFKIELVRSDKKNPSDDIIPDIINQTFNDGIRSIDFVLAYAKSNKVDDKKEKYRKIFFENLVTDGLEIEVEKIEYEKETLEFIKIHIPWDRLATCAEILDFRLPMKAAPKEEDDSIFNKMSKNFYPQPDEPEPKQKYLTAIFRKTHIQKFIRSSLYPAYISNSLRITAVYDILQSTQFAANDKTKTGVSRMVKEDILRAAFQLHENDSDERKAYLSQNWARFKKFYKPQPLERIRDYFGENFGFYFAWLGHYTTWLLVPSIVGIFVFIFNLFRIDKHIDVNDICNDRSTLMCPPCDGCPTVNLSSYCLQASVVSLFDNGGAIFFSIFMSFWSVLFMEFWKRKSTVLAYQWNTSSLDEEERPRAEFLINAKINPKTNEPEFSKFIQFRRQTTGWISIIFMVIAVLIFIVGVIIYRTVIKITLNSVGGDTIIGKYRSIISSLTGAILNLFIIVVMGKLYEKLAYFLTEWEMHKTQTEYSDSLTFKVFVFQFINFYSSIFYVGFFKNKFIGYPGNYLKVFGYRQEECQGSCMMELTIQLVLIMIGKQIASNVKEFLLPKIIGKLRSSQVKADEETKSDLEKDYFLADHEGLFEEYLEMVLQFGFITIFVISFPLAPFFALVNNWIEIRLDAQKLINDTRRPVPQRACNIGIWSDILNFLVTISVICNAFLIAFTSEFIPKTLYSAENNWSLEGYTEFSLSVYEMGNEETCRYKDFRDINGDLTLFYWKVMAIRFIFVVVFEHFVFGICKVIEAIVPDVPEEISDKIKRERHLAKLALTENMAKA